MVYLVGRVREIIEGTMGRTPDLEKGIKYQVELLWDNHKEIIRRLALGQSAVDIAHDLGVTTAVVGYVRRGELGKREIAALQEKMDGDVVNIGKRIKEMAPDALALVEAVINNDSDFLDGIAAPTHLRLNAAQDLLEKAGYTAPRRIEGAVLHGYISRTELDEIKDRARLSSNIVRSEKVEEAEVISAT